MRVLPFVALCLVASPPGLRAQTAADSLSAFERAAATQPGPINSYNAGAMHARLGHADMAFVWIGQAIQRGWADTTLLKSDPDFQSIRHDPRFTALVAAAAHNAAPCVAEPARNQFGFWVGEWTVTTKTGLRVGTSSVQIVSGGCAMLENWTSVAGANGKSLNTFNPAVGQWQQYWVGSDGTVTYYETSAWHDGSIAFLSKTPDTSTRLTFSPLPDGTVRQFGEQSTDGGKSWTARYEFFYHRKS